MNLNLHAVASLPRPSDRSHHEHSGLRAFLHFFNLSRTLRAPSTPVVRTPEPRGRTVHSAFLHFFHLSPVLRRSAARRSGFSFIELLSVVALLAMVTGFATPALQALTGAGTLNSGVQSFAGALNLARSEAIARHTVVRFAVVKDWPGNPEASFRRFSLWAWDAEAQHFFQFSEWSDLPTGVVLEPTLPDYVKTATYAGEDASSVRGDAVLDSDVLEDAEFTDGPESEPVTMRYVEFLPSGTARVTGGKSRSAIFVATPGRLMPSGEVAHAAQDGGRPKNWAQINLDTLTGRTRVYQP